MRYKFFLCFILGVLLTSCAPLSPTPPTITPTSTPILPTSTPRILMLPTWTPAPTNTPKPSQTPRPTNTPFSSVIATSASLPGGSSAALLIDRPAFATLAKPVNLVTMDYDPAAWALNTSYPTTYMGYSLSHRSIYGCLLEPTVNTSTEGYQEEKFERTLGTNGFTISRLSQAAALKYTNYCTGEGEDATCYKLTPGEDHEGCTAGAEEILSSFVLISNPFLEPLVDAPNQWQCEDQAGIAGHCTVSYSIPLYALAYLNNGEGWAGGDDGRLYRLSGQNWSDAVSPSTQPIYDVNFSSPTNGWAVGKGAQVLHWDGYQWSEVLPYHGPGEGPGGSTQVLNAVDTDSTDNAWMVGFMKDISGKNNPYAIHWNGTDMVEESTFPDCGCVLNSVLIRGENDVLAVGSSSLGAIVLHWDGQIWTSTQVAGADALYTIEKSPDGSLWTAGIEYARDQSDTRGALFRWDGSTWQRIALPPLTGGIYALAFIPTGEMILGGDFSALWSTTEWQSVLAGLAGYGWIVDIEIDTQGITWALTRSGNIFRLKVGD